MSERDNSPVGDEELIGMLRSGLDTLDRTVPVVPPEQHRLALQLEEHEAALRKSFIRELAMFITVAVLVLAGMVAAVWRVPVLFVILQTISVLAVPAFLLSQRRKRVKQP